MDELIDVIWKKKKNNILINKEKYDNILIGYH